MKPDKTCEPPAPGARVLGVEGSPRRGGNSATILEHLLNAARGRGVPAEGLKLRDLPFEPCIGCERCRKDKRCTGLEDGMTALYPRILEARGLVVVSPTHNYNVTAWMKAFIDRLYCFYEFDDDRPRGWSSRLAGQGRKAVVVAVCEQADRDDMGFTLEGMRRPLEALGYDIVGELAVLGIFDRGKVADDDAVLARAAGLGADLAAALGGR